MNNDEEYLDKLLKSMSSGEDTKTDSDSTDHQNRNLNEEFNIDSLFNSEELDPTEETLLGEDQDLFKELDKLSNHTEKTTGTELNEFLIDTDNSTIPELSEDKILSDSDLLEKDTQSIEKNMLFDEDFMLNHEDILSGSEDILAESEDIFAESEDILSGSEDILAESEDILSGSQDILAESEDILSDSDEILIDNEELLTNNKEILSNSENSLSLGEEDVTSLLDQYSDDEDLAEINDLLKKNDNNESVDEDFFSLLDKTHTEDSADENQNAAEEPFDIFAEASDEKEGKEPKLDLDNELSKIMELDANEFDDIPEKEVNIKEAKEKKVKKEKKPKRVKKGKEMDEETDILQSEIEPDPNNMNWFQKILHILTKEPEEKVVVEDNIEMDENQRLLAELEKEDKKSKTKKAPKKNKKDKKVKTDSGDSENDEDSDEPKQPTSKKKDKKPKKEKKEKVKKEAEPDNSPKLPRKPIIFISVFCLTLLVFLLTIPNIFESSITKSQARSAFYSGDYWNCYYNLLGEDLNESDQLLFVKSELILTLQGKEDSYNYFVSQNKTVNALDALMQGIETYNENKEIYTSYGIESETLALYNNMLNEFSAFGLDEEKVNTIYALNDYEYTIVLNGIAEGLSYDDASALINVENMMDESENLPAEMDNSSTVLEDILPQESGVAEEITGSN